MMGMFLTVHTQHVMHVVCDKLFGKEESDAKKTDCKEDPYAEN